MFQPRLNESLLISLITYSKPHIGFLLNSLQLWELSEVNEKALLTPEITGCKKSYLI